MAFDIAYASVDDYKAERKQIGSARDDGIERDLVAVSRVIDRRTGRQFGIADTPQERFFYPNRQNYGPRVYGMRPVGWAESENPWRWAGAMRMVAIDDLATLTGLRVVVDADGNGSFVGDPDLDLTQVEMQPLNAAVYGIPYNAIAIPDWSNIGGFQMNKKIMVVGTFGFPNVPEAIVRATIDLTAILRLESPRATRTMNEVNQVLSTTKQAQDILGELVNDYSRKSGLFDR